MTPHFERKELECSHCGEMRYTLQAVLLLEELRVDYGVPMRLSSGYRCPEHDADAHRLWHPDFTAAERHGAHTIYLDNNIAVDVLEYGANAFELVELAIAHGWQGIGLQQKGDHHKRLVHLDRLGSTMERPRPWVWTY